MSTPRILILLTLNIFFLSLIVTPCHGYNPFKGFLSKLTSKENSMTHQHYEDDEHHHDATTSTEEPSTSEGPKAAAAAGPAPEAEPAPEEAKDTTTETVSTTTENVSTSTEKEAHAWKSMAKKLKKG